MTPLLGPSSLTFRILAAFLAAMVAMLGALAFLVTQYQGVSRSQALITEGYLPLAQSVDDLQPYHDRVRRDLERLLGDAPRPGTGAASNTKIYTDDFATTLAEARIHARQARHMAEGGEEAAVLNKVLGHLDTVEDLAQAYQGRAADLIALAEGERRAEALALAEPLRRDATRLGDEITKVSRLVEGHIGDLTTATEEQRLRATAGAGALAALASVVSLALIGAVLLALRPISLLSHQVQRLAAGDYSGRLQVRGADEMARLAAEFNRLVDALQLRDRRLVERAEELNRMSRYLGSVLDSLDDGLFVVEGGLVSLTNPAARRVWGLAEGAPPHPLLADPVEQPGFYETVAPNGRPFELRVTRFGAGAVIALATDVTDQRAAKERLARSERLALVGQMLAQITHEVRNPLNALSLNAELLAEELEALDGQRRSEAWEILGTVAKEIARLTAVTGHYLQLARRPPTRLAEEDLSAILGDVGRLLKMELAREGVTLDLRTTPVEPLLADGNQLRQALLNIVRNAVQAGATHLELELVRSPDEVRVVLRDDGVGMTPEQIERACDPFYSTKATGTGLGLAITRQILEDHGGALEVASVPGRSTTVALVLPRRPALPPVEARSPAPSEAS